MPTNASISPQTQTPAGSSEAAPAAPAAAERHPHYTEGEAADASKAASPAPAPAASPEELHRISSAPTETAPAVAPVSVVEPSAEEKAASFAPPAASSPAAESADDKLLNELLHDPKKVRSDIKQEVKAELRQELAQEKNQEKANAGLWTKFYEENPDLNAAHGLTETVKRDYLRELEASGATPGWLEGSKELAKRTRVLLTSVKTETEVVDTENASKTAVVPSSGNPAPRQVKEPVSEGGFLQEMKNFKAKSGTG